MEKRSGVGKLEGLALPRSLIDDLNVGVQCVLFILVDDIRLAARAEISEDMIRI